jgi:6-phosphogluconate dehydrogenase
MFALVTMDNPIQLTPEHIRDKRAEMIEALEPVKDISTSTFRAQYEGYTAEDKVDPKSVTETYFKLETGIDHPLWHGVPIVLEAGKKFPEADKQIIITYRHPSPCLCPGDDHYKNQLYIRIQPHPGISIRFWSRKPGTKDGLEEQWLKFDYPMGETVRYTEEYTQLLLDAIAGDQTLFVSGRETMASWRFIDPIERAWRSSAKGLASYSVTKPLPATVLAAKTQDIKREIAVVGLGKMGHNLALRLQEKGWRVLGFDPKPPGDDRLPVTSSYQELVAELTGPRLIWLMVPSDLVDSVLLGKDGLAQLLEPGDIIIDGGNSYYKDTIERANQLAKKGIGFIDVGVSGGPEGARTGASLMIGGDRKPFEQWEPLFADLSVNEGYKFFPGHGAGHFVKMVHNGIEYGMMQAIAEGFTVLKKAKFDLDLKDIADVYNHGSVIESRLIGWLGRALQIHGENLDGVNGSVSHTGEGTWTVETAKELGAKAKVIEESLNFRVASASNPSFTGQILSALREQFGGHSVTNLQSSKK